MDQIYIAKHFDKHYYINENGKRIPVWPVRVVQYKERMLQQCFIQFRVEHLDSPLKGIVPDSLIRNRSIILPADSVSQMMERLQHDEQFRNFRYKIVEVKLLRESKKSIKLIKEN